VAQINPDLVSYKPDGSPFTVKYISMIGILTHALQDIDAKVVKLAADFGQWQMDEEGKLTVTELEVESIKVAGDKTVGFARIPAGQMAVDIENSNVTEKSQIFVSFLSDVAGRTWYLGNKNPGQSFTIKLSANLSYDVDFSYWIVDTDLDYAAFTASLAEPPVTPSPSPFPQGGGNEEADPAPIPEPEPPTSTTTAEITPTPTTTATTTE